MNQTALLLWCFTCVALLYCRFYIQQKTSLLSESINFFNHNAKNQEYTFQLHIIFQLSFIVSAFVLWTHTYTIMDTGAWSHASIDHTFSYCALTAIYFLAAMAFKKDTNRTIKKHCRNIIVRCGYIQRMEKMILTLEILWVIM